MSTTPATAAGSKRPLSDSSPTTTENGDHRKRRRNRTTQSCMNCHTSKRMCDRKRPCGRCTQLGLTALCVYQVDEVNPNTDNETSRLQNRVAELETIIKELKGQPSQQRWIQNEHQGTLSSSDASSRSLLMKDMSPLTPRSTSAPSPQPGSSSSSDGYIDVPAHMPHGLTDHDLGNLFNPSVQQDLSKPDALAQLIDRLAADSKAPGEFDWMSGDRAGLGHCGCASETNSYIVLLELSLRLRKASEVVGHHYKHFSGSTCGLNQKISELDKFISHVLASCNSPPGFYPSMSSPQHHHALPHTSHPHSASHSVSHSVAHSPVSGTPMSITPTGHNYAQSPMRPTMTSMGPFAMQSQMNAGHSMPYPSPPCDESMSQLERQIQAEWHHPIQGQAHSMQVS
ncbi:hypothetical protein BJ322DRAFT_1117665 [Thelephora terrestris]|uniref:Zn(2)-C6 fungal-type domain-containing protein n=1 Tax=Thelephora terrestris TaxID=56493 RepID=A0A9P6HUG8_9AGAM|nr:hypothetical protein BJ322DRAFT_1117665 [Thelephora terrestris]